MSVKRPLGSSGSGVPVPEGGKKRGVWAFRREANAAFLPRPALPPPGAEGAEENFGNHW